MAKNIVSKKSQFEGHLNIVYRFFPNILASIPCDLNFEQLTESLWRSQNSQYCLLKLPTNSYSSLDNYMKKICCTKIL